MFIIRKEQMRVFDDYAYKQFVDDMVVHLRTHYSKQIAEMTETDLRQMIEEGIERAEKYDVVTVTDVERFLGCMVMLGQNFDNDPETAWAGDILRNENMSGTFKMDTIDEHLNFSSMERV
jgi:hypothetical protein